MSRTPKSAPVHAVPLWMRWVAAVCLVVFSAVATAQAVHVHGDWLPHNKAQLQAPAQTTQAGGEEHCPLCIALHSVLPGSVQTPPAPPELSVAVPGERASRRPEAPWPFANFSRPPPMRPA